MNRLTTKDTCYCKEKCGQARFCQRLQRGDICLSARCYDRLRQYEDTGLMPEEITARRCPAEKEEKMTNRERLFHMSDQELGRWICQFAAADFCPHCPANAKCSYGQNGLEKWLGLDAGEGVGSCT